MKIVTSLRITSIPERKEIRDSLDQNLLSILIDSNIYPILIPNSFGLYRNSKKLIRYLDKIKPNLRDKGNCWFIPYETRQSKLERGKHPATFPIKLVEDCIKLTGKESGVVLDPFGGAGTTGIVAQSLNRTAILIELNPEYIEIAKKRIDKELGMFR